MNMLVFFALAGIVLGMAGAFYIVTGQIKKSNELGNTKGDRWDYTSSFDMINARDDVAPGLNIDKL